jgi:hypothetical protein
MTRNCEWCGEIIAFFDAQTTSGNTTWHTRYWNQAAEQRAAYIAECEDSQGFTRRCDDCTEEALKPIERTPPKLVRIEHQQGDSFLEVA